MFIYPVSIFCFLIFLSICFICPAQTKKGVGIDLLYLHQNNNLSGGGIAFRFRAGNNKHLGWGFNYIYRRDPSLPLYPSLSLTTDITIGRKRFQPYIGADWGVTHTGKTEYNPKTKKNSVIYNPLIAPRVGFLLYIAPKTAINAGMRYDMIFGDKQFKYIGFYAGLRFYFVNDKIKK